MLTGEYNILWVLLFSGLHELGHLAVLYAAGGKAARIKLAFYGIGLVQKGTLTNLRQIIFLFGGIAVNAAFSLLNIHREINLALLVMNSLPVYPLDGGRILKLCLNNVLTLDLSDKVFKLLSIVIIILFIALAAYVKNVSLLLIAAYVILYSINNSTD